MATTSAEELTALYDALAHYQWWLRRCRRTAPGEGLEMHKSLAVDPLGVGPPAGAADLHGWLWDQAGVPEDAHTLDVGCGFGATLLHWSRASNHRGSPEDANQLTGVGISGSPYQVRKAQQMARTLGLDERVGFECQQFDVAWPACGEGWRTRPFDLICAVEALGHSADLGALLDRMAAGLRSGGRIVLLEDMAKESGRGARDELEPIRQQLRDRWSLTRLATRVDYLRELNNAGCTVVAEHDLTAQVQCAPDSLLGRRERRLGWMRRYAPARTARRVLDAFLGGIDLERLYAAGAMEYRLIVAERN